MDMYNVCSSDYSIENWPPYMGADCGSQAGPDSQVPLAILSSLSNPGSHPHHPHHHHQRAMQSPCEQQTGMPHHFSNADALSNPFFHQSWLQHLKARGAFFHEQNPNHPHTIARRNERERNRVKTINSTFSTLRHHLPSASKSKKLSKVQILKSAIGYIRQLKQVLEVQGEQEGGRVKCNSESSDQDNGETRLTIKKESDIHFEGDFNDTLRDSKQDFDSVNQASELSPESRYGVSSPTSHYDNDSASADSEEENQASQALLDTFAGWMS